MTSLLRNPRLVFRNFRIRSGSALGAYHKTMEDDQTGKKHQSGGMGSFVTKYGWPFVVVYAMLSLMIFVLIYAALVQGFDVGPFLSRVGIESSGAQTTSLVLVAIACTKLLVPVKLPVAGAITYVFTRRRPLPQPEQEATCLLSDLDFEEDDDASEYCDPEDDDDDEPVFVSRPSSSGDNV